MTTMAMTRWQVQATDGRRPLGRVFTVNGQAAANEAARKWVLALGKPWTLVKIECLDTAEVP